ncbi:MAG: hypothetical protein U9Q83_04815 [Bacteroidota bacterium]|nr:hypothetical protein [Bacteroidota bacterium]
MKNKFLTAVAVVGLAFAVNSAKAENLKVLNINSDDTYKTQVDNDFTTTQDLFTSFDVDEKNLNKNKKPKKPETLDDDDPLSIPLSTLKENPTFKANWDRANELFNEDARTIVPKILLENGELSKDQKTAFLMANYSAYKELPGNFSHNDKKNNLLFYYGVTSYPDDKVEEDFKALMIEIQKRMEDEDLTGIETPKVPVSQEDKDITTSELF